MVHNLLHFKSILCVSTKISWRGYTSVISPLGKQHDIWQVEESFFTFVPQENFSQSQNSSNQKIKC